MPVNLTKEKQHKKHIFNNGTNWYQCTGEKPAEDDLCTDLGPFTALDRNRYGLNWLASCPQQESSICTNCTGTTSIDPAGMVKPVFRFKSCCKKRKKNNQRKNMGKEICLRNKWEQQARTMTK